MGQGMNRPRGKWPVGKRKPPQSDEHVSIFIENSYGLVRFGFRGAVLAVFYYGFCRFWPKTSKNLRVFKVFTWKYANWLGGVAKFDARNPSSRNESIVRKWPGKIKFLVRVFRFPRKWPVGTSILLESGIVLEFQTAKTLESGIVLTQKRLRVVSFLNLGYQFRLRNSSFLTLK